jgi:hypothetical protein
MMIGQGHHPTEQSAFKERLFHVIVVVSVIPHPAVAVASSQVENGQAGRMRAQAA